MKFQGRDKLLQRMKRMPKVARNEFRGALEKNAQEMAGLVKRLAPERTGALRKSIGYTFGDFAPQNANVRGVVGAGRGDRDLTVTVHAGDEEAWYAALVEFGTEKSAAQPYFFPAYRLMKKRARSRLARANRKAVQAVTSGNR